MTGVDLTTIGNIRGAACAGWVRCWPSPSLTRVVCGQPQSSTPHPSIFYVGLDRPRFACYLGLGLTCLPMDYSTEYTECTVLYSIYIC